jgi:hypothetical protein
MKKSRSKEEQIVGVLHEAEVGVSVKEFEIVPGLVESSGSRRTARYATWTC